MGKMLAITGKQSCSPACSDSHHYPGKSIMRHGGREGGGSIWQPHSINGSILAEQLSARHMSGQSLLLNTQQRMGERPAWGGVIIVSLLHYVVMIM